MNILETIIQLRDDLKTWVTNNLKALDKKLDDNIISIDKKINNIPKFSGDYNDLTNAPNIAEDDSDEINITDENGNVIFKIDDGGAHTTAMSLNGKDVSSELNRIEDSIKNIQGFSGDYNDLTNAPNIAEDESGDLTIADENGNVILKVDEGGIHTTSISINGEYAATEKYVDDAISNINIPETDFTGFATEDYVDNKVSNLVDSAPEALNTIGELAIAMKNHEDAYDALLETVGKKATLTDLENLKTEISESITSETEDFHIVDNEGNIIASIDENGISATTVTANNIVVNGNDVEGHLSNSNIHVTLEEKAAWNSVEAIIDVVTLPTENIVENNFYRSLKVDCVYYKGIQNDFIIYAVETLPETGEVVTDAEISFLKFYFSVENNEAYGYVDETLAAAHGFPITGWIDFETMINAAGGTYGGVIKHIDDAKEDEVWYILLSHSLHIYKDGWKELPYAYESEPEFDITWDGVIGDKFALDMSPLGYEHHFMVKVSDEVIGLEQLKNAVMFDRYGDSFDLSDDDASIDTEMYPGAITVKNGEAVIVYSAEDTNTALGLPDGYLTNGVYFLYTEELMEDDIVQPETWTARLVAKPQITKIDIKYIDVEPICEEIYWDIRNDLHWVAFSGSYSDLANKPNLKTVATSGNYNDLSNKPTIYTDVIRYNATQYLSSTSKSTARSNIDVYSKSEVDDKIANSSSNVDLTGYAKTTDVATMIAEAIGVAIGGSY